LVGVDPMNRMIVLAAVAVIVLGRGFITPRLGSVPSFEGFYESFAHLVVGFLVLVRFYDPTERLGPSRDMAVLGWLLALYELVWFLVQKFAT
jgi:hypothetical protein